MYSKRFILESLMIIGEYDYIGDEYGVAAYVEEGEDDAPIKPAQLKQIAAGAYLIVSGHVLEDDESILVRENDLVLTDYDDNSHICNPLGTIGGVWDTHFLKLLKKNVEDCVRKESGSEYATLNFLMTATEFMIITLNIPDKDIEDLDRFKNLLRKSIAKATDDMYKEMNEFINFTDNNETYVNIIQIELFTKESLAETPLLLYIDTPLSEHVRGN